MTDSFPRVLDLTRHKKSAAQAMQHRRLKAIKVLREQLRTYVEDQPQLTSVLDVGRRLPALALALLARLSS